jgi:hypothetical protein
MRKRKKRVAVHAPVPPPISPAPPPPLPHLREVQRLALLGYSDNDINRSLANDVLLAVTTDELGRVRAALHPPRAFRPLSAKHAASAAYLRELGLLDIVRQTPEANEAVALLHDARAREIVEAAAVVAVPAHAVVHVLAQLVRHAVSAAGLRLFYRMFFDITTISRTELRLVVARHVEALVVRGVREESLPAARRAVRQDARVVALAVSQSHVGWAGVLATLGWLPPPQDLARLVAQIEQLAGVRAAQAVFRDGRDDARRAEAYVHVLAQALELKQQVVDPNTALLKKLRAVSLRTAPERIPTIDEVAGTNHTVDLNPPNRVDEDPLAAEYSAEPTGTE